MKEQAESNRIMYLDIVRTVAIVSITMNHACSRSFETAQNTLQEFISIPVAVSVVKALIYVFSRIGVPLFLMLTGTLLLDRDYSDKNVFNHFIKHNLLTLFITTEIWLCIMFWYLKLPHVNEWISQSLGVLKDFVLNQLFINQTTMGSMWYMPMVLCIYLMIPIVSVALRNIEHRLITVIYVILLLSGMIIPNIYVFLQLTGYDVILSFGLVSHNLLSHYWLFILAGYFIGKGILDRWKTYQIAAVCFLSYALTVAFQIWVYASELDYRIMYSDTGTLIASAFCFELMRRLCNTKNRLTPVFSYISRISFGIYFVHICIMTGLDWVIKKEQLYYLPRFALLETVSFVGSILIIQIVSRIGWCKKYLFVIK